MYSFLKKKDFRHRDILVTKIKLIQQHCSSKPMLMQSTTLARECSRLQHFSKAAMHRKKYISTAKAYGCQNVHL